MVCGAELKLWIRHAR